MKRTNPSSALPHPGTSASGAAERVLGADGTLLGVCLLFVFAIGLLPLGMATGVHLSLLGISALAIAVARIPLGHLQSRMLLVLPALLSALLILPWIGQGARAEVFGLSYSIEGCRRAGATAVKLLSITLWVSLITWKLPPHRLFAALAALRCPDWLIEILRSTYRNLAVLSTEVASMRRALQSRTIRPGRWAAKAAGTMIGLLFLRARKRASRQLIADELRHPGSDASLPMEPPSIRISNLSYCYPGCRTDALQGICLEIPAGEKVAILGCNGAGKTTLLLHLNAVLPVQSGSVNVSGIDVNRANRPLIRQEVGMVFQNPEDQILAMTVREDVAIGPRQQALSDEQADARVEFALRQVGLWNHRDQPPHQLSAGQCKRLALAGVLAAGSRVILLDEPMAALDPPGRDEIVVLLNDLHAEGHTIMAATHDLGFAAEWATMVVVMDSGRMLAAGPAEAILASPELMAEVGFRHIGQPIRASRRR